jgi:hypothetical protein
MESSRGCFLLRDHTSNYFSDSHEQSKSNSCIDNRSGSYSADDGGRADGMTLAALH